MSASGGAILVDGVVGNAEMQLRELRGCLDTGTMMEARVEYKAPRTLCIGRLIIARESHEVMFVNDDASGGVNDL